MRISDWSSDVCSSDLISIKSGCDDAPYRERDVDNPDWEPKREDVEFWDRVKANADRISEWALSGLAISRRAIPLADGELDEARSEEHTSELQSLMRISYAVFCLKKQQHIKR